MLTSDERSIEKLIGSSLPAPVVEGRALDQQHHAGRAFTPVREASSVGEINRLRKDAPGAPELDGIKNNMIGIFTLRNASRGGIVNQLAEADLQGLGDDYLSGYVKRVMAVSPAEVQRITTMYLKSDRMTLVVVGDKATVAEQLAPYQRPIP